MEYWGLLWALWKSHFAIVPQWCHMQDENGHIVCRVKANNNMNSGSGVSRVYNGQNILLLYIMQLKVQISWELSLNSLIFQNSGSQPF